jgi:hypothetical protein
VSKEKLWKLYFDVVASREGAWVGVLLIPPLGDSISLSYKL